MTPGLLCITAAVAGVAGCARGGACWVGGMVVSAWQRLGMQAWCLLDRANSVTMRPAWQESCLCAQLRTAFMAYALVCSVVALLNDCISRLAWRYMMILGFALGSTSSSCSHHRSCWLQCCHSSHNSVLVPKGMWCAGSSIISMYVQYHSGMRRW